MPFASYCFHPSADGGGLTREISWPWMIWLAKMDLPGGRVLLDAQYNGFWQYMRDPK